MYYANTPEYRTWRAEGLRWIAGLLQDAADSIERSQSAHYLADERAPEYKPVEEFLYDARFRVQNGY
ncbi:hypothetical protein DSM104443_00944 [Usitatibacter rugosus]|uniref:Uncharacterized protein n=2 Tax=Usitatibacter rugosus TaxID=2732067 RepID=A0A6M4GU83_9PROT|nr:hypothetical protein DSM104443_00944 [Usitatibacter rugosus]